MRKEMKRTVWGLVLAVILGAFLLLWFRSRQDSRELVEDVFFA